MPETKPFTINPLQAANRAYDAGHAQWYLSGGEKIEFTALGFAAWYEAEVAAVRATVADEIAARRCSYARMCNDCLCRREDAAIARGDRP